MRPYIRGPMFRDRVVEHYRVRGYKIHQDVKVRGRSGGIHACDMVAQGPLGNLIVSFGDAGGFEGPELAAVRSAAQDIGAAPVVAVPRAPTRVQEAARTLGVKLLDEEAVGAPNPVGRDEEAPEFAAHPWPDAAPRVRKEASKATLWKHPRGAPEAAEPKPSNSGGSFAWLKQAGKASEAPKDGTFGAPVGGLDNGMEPPANVVKVPVIREVERQAFEWKWVVGPAVYGLVTALVLFLFLALFL